MIALDEGQAAGLGIMLATIAFVFGFRLMRKFRLEWIIAGKIRQPTVDGLLKFQENLPKQEGILPEAAFLRALGRSMALAYYGHWMGSMNQVNAFDMSDKPIFRSMQLLVEVVNNFLQRRDLPASLDIARQCALDVRSRNASGVNTTANSYDTWIKVGEVLNNLATPETIRSLERRLRGSTFMLKLAIAWALCIAYKRQGDHGRSEKFRNWLLRSAPYCTPFLNTD
jgi:hypothetical protein